MATTSHDPQYPNPHPRFSIPLRSTGELNTKEWHSEPANQELTNWKQLLTLGSMLLPPKEATSPSCRGIWMESCSSSPSRRWSQKPVELATCLNRSAGRRRTPEVKQCYQDVASSPDLCGSQGSQVWSTASEDRNTNVTSIWLLLFP